MKDKLIQTAGKLSVPSNETVNQFASQREALVSQCNKLFLKRSDIHQLVGEKNIDMAKDNNHNFSRFMESMFSDYDPEIFVETVLWVFRAYRSHGFKTTYWPANLNIWIDTLKDQLDQTDFDQVYPFYNWLIINIPAFVKLTDNLPDAPSPSNLGQHD